MARFLRKKKPGLFVFRSRDGVIDTTIACRWNRIRTRMWRIMIIWRSSLAASCFSQPVAPESKTRPHRRSRKSSPCSTSPDDVSCRRIVSPKSAASNNHRRRYRGKVSPRAGARPLHESEARGCQRLRTSGHDHRRQITSAIGESRTLNFSSRIPMLQAGRPISS